MLPTNVMSFMKKMVAQEETSSQNSSSESTFGKLKQTLSSSLLTAQDRVNKISPRPSLVPDSADNPTQNAQINEQVPQELQAPKVAQKNEPGKPPNRAGACRVCLKSFKPEDFSKTCFECKYRVCEDCASYSKVDSSEDLSTWRCSVCRRKMASRICIPQDSTDSQLDVPILEALQRRHSDVKLNAVNHQLGLAPPRSPELRRHSDVSPASLKELEKLKGGGSKTPNDSDWESKNRSNAPSRSNSPPRRIEIEPPTRAGSRRQSIRVSRQHSYDDDIQKNAIANSQPNNDLALNLPAQIPRRKSAYDVFGGSTPNQQQQIQQLSANMNEKQPGSRRGSFRIPTQDDFQKDESPSPDNGPTLLIDDDRRMRRRGSQLPDISALKCKSAMMGNVSSTTLTLNPVNPYQGPALEDLEAPKRQTSLDGEAIKIVIHDVDSGPSCASKRRVILRRDPSDKAHRTRGFGMRVVGGKTGADGKLFAHIVWTVSGGPAEKGGLQQGDKILEWCGVSLVDRSFEEVCAIMDRTGDIAELLVEQATDFRMCDLLEDGGNQGNHGGNGGGEPDASLEKSPVSPTRRKLPKTPEQIAREKQVSGRVQVQVWYHDDRNELVVNLMAADDLSLRDDTIGYGNQPEAYAKVKILPKIGDGQIAQTEVSVPTQAPIWNATMTFDIGSGVNLLDRCIEITLWDLVPQTDATFLGECNVDLQRAFLEDRAVWVRLEDPKGLRGQSFSKTPNASPRGSIGGDVSRFIRRNEYGIQRSMSDDCDSIGDGNSLLHPDHAYVGNSRRGSSQSETLEVETYQLGKDFSRSLPGSRRSSFQDQEKKNGEATPPVPTYVLGRRRSSVARKDPDEILRSLKAVRGELGRTMSLQRETEYLSSSSRRSSRTLKDSIPNINEVSIGVPMYNERYLMDIKRKGSGNFHTSAETFLQEVILGPGQMNLTGYRLSSLRFGEIKIEFKISNCMLELKIIAARNIVPINADAPDTYVKCYLRDSNDHLRQKKKTDIVRHESNPKYNQIIKYSMSEVYRRSILVMVWQRCIGFEQNQGLGGAEIFFDNFQFEQLHGGWYPMLPMHSLKFDSNHSP
ncbi:unnamed protein product [Diamesa serratosioi]